MEMLTYRIIVSGVVQGVGYRYFAKNTADSFGVRGWVRNLRDGRVEVMAQVPDEETQKRFINALEEGPSFGRVTGIDVTPVNEPSKFDSFEIT